MAAISVALGRAPVMSVRSSGRDDQMLRTPARVRGGEICRLPTPRGDEEMLMTGGP